MSEALLFGLLLGAVGLGSSKNDSDDNDNDSSDPAPDSIISKSFIETGYDPYRYMA